MSLDCVDGKAIIGYAGLGAKALGTEPSDWVSNVLQGRNATLEQSLSILSEAMKRQFPKHLARLQWSGAPTHSFIVPAEVNNRMELYSDLAFKRNTEDYFFRYTKWKTKVSDKKNFTLRAGYGW